MEREYHDITYKELEELRQNSLVRLNTTNKIEATTKFIALDETQEIINWMTKLLPLGSDKESWLYHSRNLMFASKSNAYEKQGQVNNDLQYDDLEQNIIKKVDITKTKSTTEPRKNIERFCLYEWAVLKYGTYSANRSIYTKDGFSYVSKLSMKLNEEIVSNTEKDGNLYSECISPGC